MRTNEVITIFNTQIELKNFTNSVNSNVHWTYLFRHDFLLENNLFFIEKIFHQDFLTILWLSLVQKAACINEVGYYYRIRQGSTITNKNLSHLTQSYQSYSVVTKEIISFMTNHKANEFVYFIGLKLFFKAIDYKTRPIVRKPSIKVKYQALLNDFYQLFKALALYDGQHNEKILREAMQQRGFSRKLAKNITGIICRQPLNEKALTKALNSWLCILIIKKYLKLLTPHQLLSLKRKLMEK